MLKTGFPGDGEARFCIYPKEERVRVHVLGSGAGGGFPQWNCNCPNCHDFRAGRVKAQARTQASLAVSADGQDWVLINAGPDIRQQIQAFSALEPAHSPRHTPISAVLLTNAEIDHVAGLLSLRESQPLSLYASHQVQAWLLETNAMFRTVCAPPRCTWHGLEYGAAYDLIGVDGQPSGLVYEAFVVPGRAPAYLLGRVSDWSEAAVGYRISDCRSGRSLVYVPGIKALDDSVMAYLRNCDAFFLDGTCWTDDEMISVGLAQKTSLSMGHIPMTGPDGSLAGLAALDKVRKIYTHLNNTNPVLIEDSDQRRTVEAAGWEVAFDGMDFEV